MTMPDPLDRVTFRGKLMDRKTAAALAVLEQRLGYELTVIQGCYNAGGVSASAGTHDRGGVIDLSRFDFERKVKALRDLGFAAWHRTALPGVWGEHIHAVMIGHQDLAPSAARQVVSFEAGRDGLAGNGIDPDHYHPTVEPFSFKDAWRDGLLSQRITGLTARIKALRERRAAAKARITYRTPK